MRLAVALLLGSWAASRAFAQDAPFVPGNPLPSFIPSLTEEERTRELALERELALTLQKLAHVREARVHLDLPPPFAALDHPPPAGSASLLLVADGPTLDDEAVRALVRGAALELAGASIAITRSEVRRPSASEPLVSIGPLRVSPQSAPLTRALLGGLLASNVFLATVLIAYVRRKTVIH